MARPIKETPILFDKDAWGKQNVEINTIGLRRGYTGHEMLNGGNFGNGMAAGAISSGLGSLAQGIGMSQGVMIASSSVIGGVAAWATGGNFLMGALQGMKVGLFNHSHDYKEDTLYKDENENLFYFCHEVICVASRMAPSHELTLGEVIATAEDLAGRTETANTVLNNIGKSSSGNGGNSTFGSNGRFYFHPEGAKGFNGNQYVRTVKLTTVGEKIIKVTGPVGLFIDGTHVASAACTDYSNYKNNGYTDGYNTVKAAASWAGGLVGGSYGFSAGVSWGMSFGAGVGGLFFGVGAIPCTIIGGIVGGIVGTLGGGWLGEYVVDVMYKK